MNAARPDVSVVIVSWNVADLLLRSIRSLQEHHPDLALELLVVDNASIDGSPERVRRAVPAARVIANAENVGFARANNQGLALARGRYVLLVNPDTEWLDDSLRKMVAYMDAHPETGVIGPKLLNVDRQSIQFDGGRRLPRPFDTFCEYTRLPQLLPHSGWVRRHLMPEWDHADSRPVECLSGACLLIRREALQEIGPLDEGYPFNIEDIDWCHRVMRSPWRQHYLGDAQLVHVGRQSILKNRGHAALSAMRGVYRYYAKFYGRGTALAAWMLLWPASVAKLLMWTAILVGRPGRRAMAREQIATFWKICGLSPWPHVEPL